MKTNKLKALFVLAAVVTMATVINCGGGSNPPPTTGFKVKGENWIPVIGGGSTFFSGTSVQADWQHDNGSAQGSVYHYVAFTSSGAFANVDNGRVPARWSIFPTGGCIQYLDVFQRDVTAGSSQTARCLVFGFFLTANPDSVDLYSPPAVVTFAGGGFSAAYGMPVIEYYDEYTGVLIASTTAFSVATDGTTLVAYTPDLSGVYTGAYTVVVSNKASDGSNNMVGVAGFSTCCINPPPPDPPPDPPECGGNQVCLIQ